MAVVFTVCHPYQTRWAWNNEDQQELQTQVHLKRRCTRLKKSRMIRFTRTSFTSVKLSNMNLKTKQDEFGFSQRSEFYHHDRIALMSATLARNPRSVSNSMN